MLIKDEQRLANTVKLDRIMQTRDNDKKYLEHTMQDAYMLSDIDNSPINPERQLGTPLTVQKLEEIVLQLAPHVFIWKGKDKHAIYQHHNIKINAHNIPDESSSRYLICVYQTDTPLPEYSIFMAKREEVPDYERIFNGKPITYWETEEAKKTGAARPGWKYEYIPDMEIRRGWRTVFGRMIQAGLTHADAVERIVGVGTRVSWAAMVGKTNDQSPF